MTEPRAPSLAGSSGKDSPSLTGWGIAAFQADQERPMSERIPLYDRLRQDHEAPSFELMQAVPREAWEAFAASMLNWISEDLGGLWFPVDERQGHTPDGMAEAIAGRFSSMAKAFESPLTQSPIENRLLGALLWMDADWAGLPSLDATGEGPSIGGGAPYDEHGPEYWITPQATVAGYRVDFLVWFAMKRHVAGIAIECDGHEFHERTKEQAARDKRRDREIATAGFPVFRFTGSEIFRDVTGCAAQVREALSEPLNRVSRDGGLF